MLWCPGAAFYTAFKSACVWSDHTTLLFLSPRLRTRLRAAAAFCHFFLIRLSHSLTPPQRLNPRARTCSSTQIMALQEKEWTLRFSVCLRPSMLTQSPPHSRQNWSATQCWCVVFIGGGQTLSVAPRGSLCVCWCRVDCVCLRPCVCVCVC